MLSKQLSSRYAGQLFTVVNEGVPNEQVREGAVRFNGVLSTSLPQVVLLLEGVNDIDVGGATSISGGVKDGMFERTGELRRARMACQP